MSDKSSSASSPVDSEQSIERDLTELPRKTRKKKKVRRKLVLRGQRYPHVYPKESSKLFKRTMSSNLAKKKEYSSLVNAFGGNKEQIFELFAKSVKSVLCLSEHRTTIKSFCQILDAFVEEAREKVGFPERPENARDFETIINEQFKKKNVRITEELMRNLEKPESLKTWSDTEVLGEFLFEFTASLHTREGMPPVLRKITKTALKALNEYAQAPLGENPGEEDDGLDSEEGTSDSDSSDSESEDRISYFEEQDFEDSSEDDAEHSEHDSDPKDSIEPNYEQLKKDAEEFKEIIRTLLTNDYQDLKQAFAGETEKIVEFFIETIANSFKTIGNKPPLETVLGTVEKFVERAMMAGKFPRLGNFQYLAASSMLRTTARQSFEEENIVESELIMVRPDLIIIRKAKSDDVTVGMFLHALKKALRYFLPLETLYPKVLGPFLKSVNGYAARSQENQSIPGSLKRQREEAPGSDNLEYKSKWMKTRETR